MHASHLDVLRKLASEAADTLVGCLRDKRALSAARLACHALRTFVDNNTTSLSIKVRAADRQRWEAGQPPPPLATRWPRCTHVTLRIVDGPGEDAAWLALLPFAQQGAGSGVETLQMFSAPGGTCGESLAYMLVPLLPKLRDLDFWLDGCMSFSPFKQQLMFSALAALPRLERLVLPGCRSLDHVGTLAANLRCLIIVDRYGEKILSAAAIAGLLQLQRLEELELPFCQLGAAGSGGEAPSGVHALLRANLPASLQQLTVGLAHHGVLLSLQLHAGSFSRVTIMESSNLDLHGLAASAQLLLCSPAMGPTLELLTIEAYLALDGSHRDRQQADQVQLCRLLQRCVKVQTDRVWITSDVPAATVVQLLPLLGPDEVNLHVDDDREFCFRYPSASGRMPGISGPRAGMGTGAIISSSMDAAVQLTTEGQGFQQQCSPPPGPADLLWAALQCMAVGGGGSRSQQAASSNAVPVTGSSSTPEGSLLLLRGPFLAMMAASGQVPTEWVRCLAAKADAAAPGNDWGGMPVLSCQAVPLVNGVLLSCSSTTAAVGVMAAVGAAAEAAVPVPLLDEIVRLQSAYAFNDAKTIIFRALEPAMTAFWEGSAHGGEHCTQRERLQCMLALREVFNALPDEVDL